MTVLVTGAAGQLGAAIVQDFARGYDVVGLTRRELDITDHRAVLGVIASVRPSVVINCAAYNDVDGAEEHHVEALNVNAFGVRSLACASMSAGAVLVHYSTDFVFAGTATEPYAETDQPDPKSCYASSKLIGEWFAQDAPRHYVLRVESLFGGSVESARHGSIDRIIERIEAGADTPVFVDRTVSPSYVADVVAATRALVERPVPPGLYHCVNSGYCTWEELAREAARLLRREPRLTPVTTAEMRLRATRPKFCALSNDKLAGVGIRMPCWTDALERHIGARPS